MTRKTTEVLSREFLELEEQSRRNPIGGSRLFKLLLAGDLNAGKSSVRSNLARFLGMKDFYVGDVFREMARNRGQTLNDFYSSLDPETEKSIDRKWILEKLLLNRRILIEGRIAPFVETVAAQLGITLPSWEKAIRIKLCLTVDEGVGAQRALQRPENAGKTLKQIIEESRVRMNNERKHYLDLYGIIDHTDRTLFDIVIDTTRITQQEVLQEAYYMISELVKKNE
ncbi:MAG: hypothetical protein AAB617_01865 [Patescibacteria group bacterium]